MDTQKVDMFLMTSGKYFHSYHLNQVREALTDMDDSRWSLLQMTQFKDPNIMLIVSLLGGSLGIDRFMLGDTGLGIGKLLTCGGFGIWTIVDWFLIMGETRNKNIEKFMMAVG